MRITGGRQRGRPLAAPPGLSVRPTADRAREALFDILAGGRVFDDFTLEGASVLDVFAGTGAVGLEALSRGAKHACFLEHDRAALAALRQNIARLGEEARTMVLARDAIRPGRASEAFGFAFLDPPYGEALAEPALAALHQHGWIAPGAPVVLETGSRENVVVPDPFEQLDERRYGAARFRLLRA